MKRDISWLTQKLREVRIIWCMELQLMSAVEGKGKASTFSGRDK